MMTKTEEKRWRHINKYNQTEDLRRILCLKFVPACYLDDGKMEFGRFVLCISEWHTWTDLKSSQNWRNALALVLTVTMQFMGTSPGLVVMWRDSCSEGCEGRIPALHTAWTFFTFICCKICNVCLKRRK